MHNFTNDYSEGAHPKVLEIMLESNLEQNEGYGLDKHSERARELIRRWIDMPNADVHSYLAAPKQTCGCIVLLRPHQCVISADTGHINVHETELLRLQATSRDSAGNRWCSHHNSSRVLLALTWTSTWFSQRWYIYQILQSWVLSTQKSELQDIRETCLKNGLLLYLDGARIVRRSHLV